jgi:transcription elongation factor Elf1
LSEKVSEEIRQVEPVDEFRICLACGYERGFHVSFLHDGGDPRIVLICPNCGARYDAGWRAKL